MTTCYRVSVDDQQREEVRAAQERVTRAEEEWRDALDARNELFARLYDRGVMPAAIGSVVDMHRTTVDRHIRTARRSRR